MTAAHRPAPPARFFDLLRSPVPTWVFGLEEPGTRLAQLKRLGALAAEHPECVDATLGLARWSWTISPLMPETAAALSGLDRQVPFLSPRCRALLNTLTPRLHLDLDVADWRVLLDSGETGLLVKHLMPRLRNPESAVFWLSRSWDHLLRLGNADLAATVVGATHWPDDLAPLRERLLAEWAFHFLPPDEAFEYLKRIPDEIWGPWATALRAELLLRAGEAEAAVGELRATREALPWDPGATLRLHARTLGRAAPATPGADVCVLLYSWNKADLLDATLRDLAACDLGGARVFALDNGSTDHMGETMRRAGERFAQRFGPGRFTVVRLPVNVGAPAARNWLLSLPEVRACRWAAFLDDDVALAGDWLPRLLGHALAAPDDTACVGCRITSAGTPRALQSADYHLFEPGGASGFRDLSEHIAVYDNCDDGLDLGLHGYVRPAISVSGCCHLLRMDAVRAVGGFDIRFSPTQFDDLERDLRCGLAGYGVRYAGDVVVRHIQHSSLARASSTASVGHVFGNKIKLEGKYDETAVRELARRHADELWDDLARKCAELDDAAG